MKNARQPKSTSAEGPGNRIAGALPMRKNTVTASVLTALLEGQSVTGMEAVFEHSTTRAAAFIYYLEAVNAGPNPTLNDGVFVTRHGN